MLREITDNHELEYYSPQGNLEDEDAITKETVRTVIKRLFFPICSRHVDMTKTIHYPEALGHPMCGL
jgi:hypothetical protein